MRCRTLELDVARHGALFVHNAACAWVNYLHKSDAVSAVRPPKVTRPALGTYRLVAELAYGVRRIRADSARRENRSFNLSFWSSLGVPLENSSKDVDTEVPPHFALPHNLRDVALVLALHLCLRDLFLLQVVA